MLMDEHSPTGEQGDSGGHINEGVGQGNTQRIHPPQEQEVASHAHSQPRAQAEGTVKRGLRVFVANIKSFVAKIEQWNSERPKREPAKWTDKVMTVATVVIAGWAGLQWWEMHGTGSQTDALIEAARIQARASGRSSISARQIVSDNKQALSDNKQAFANTLKENRAEMAEAMRQNREAINASLTQGQRALDASIAASRLDQRPWVILSRFELSEDPQPDRDFTATFWVVNSGKTPALNVAPASRLSLWTGQPPPVDFGTRTGLPNQGIITPGGVGDLHFMSDPWRLTRIQVDAYRAGTTRIYAQVLIDYTDAFVNSTPHWTRICVWHANGRPLTEFGFCDQGNEMDHQ